MNKIKNKPNHKRSHLHNMEATSHTHKKNPLLKMGQPQKKSTDVNSSEIIDIMA
jgi:hypothetical protein